jgi:hypothetical protein
LTAKLLLKHLKYNLRRIILLRRKLLLFGLFLFVLLCSSLVVSVEAAASTWSQTYGGTGVEVASSLVVASDGGYAIAGSMLVKTDAGGNMQWNKSYGGDSLVATSDGGYALAGGSLLVKTDALGNMVWNRTYGEGTVFSLVAALDGGYALAGDTESLGAGGADFWVLKTNENGFVPEYSSWLIPSLVLTATAFIILNKKRLLHKRS